MPILVIHGMPDEIPQTSGLRTTLRKSVLAFPDLELIPDQVSVFYCADRVGEDIGKEIIVFVRGLFPKPKRTRIIQQAWAESIRTILVGFTNPHLPQCKLIEVLVETFNPDVSAFVSTKL
jgi:hypothetical protein